MSKDYTSFSSIAKSRFSDMAKKLGYEQITGILYVKNRDGWYETFNLQSSSYGNPFFYFNYGVILPKQFPASREELKCSGCYLGARLEYKGKGAFPAGTKKEVEQSAGYALDVYEQEIVPMFIKLDRDIVFKAINCKESYELYLNPMKQLLEDIERDDSYKDIWKSS